MTMEPPGLIVPAAHGKALQPPPLTETGVRPGGVGSEMNVFAAASAPLFVMVIV